MLSIIQDMDRTLSSATTKNLERNKDNLIYHSGYDEATESFLLNDGHGLGPEAPDLESASEKLARLRSRSNLGGHPHSKSIRKKFDEKNEPMRVLQDSIPKDKLMGKIYEFNDAMRYLCMLGQPFD